MIRRFTLLGLLAALSIALVACGSDDNGGSGTTGSAGAATTTTSTQGTTADSADAGTTVEQSTIDVTSKFLGVSPGKADESLPPLKIGFVNMEGGIPSFPEHQAAADSTVKFINEHLGGVDGHPLELTKCLIQSEEDGQKCAGEMLAAKVPIVNLGLAVVGNAPFYKTINGKFPVIVNGQGGGADVTTPKVYLTDPGGVGQIGGMTKVAQKIGGIKKIAVIASSNPAGKFGIEEILNPTLKPAGITSTTIYVADDASAPDYVSAMQASGAAKADAVFLETLAQGCQNSYDAMKQLAIKKPVVAIGSCYGDQFVNHAGDGLEGWYFTGFTRNPRILDDPEAAAYRNLMKAYGQEKYTFTGIAPKTLQDLLLITKFGNTLGYDKITADAMDEQIRSYRGPGFIIAGDIKCDGKVPGTPGVCSTAEIASTFKNGAFENFEL
jgi:branched-chain amino acid transport system substrate-binding protein